MSTADTAKMVAELGLRDKMSAGIDKAIGKIGKLETRVSRLGSHVQRGLGNAARNTERAVVVGITGAVAGLTYAVKQATDAESAVAGIAKTVDGDISVVVDGLKALSNQIPVSFVELAHIAELGGAMGIAKKDLVAYTKQVAILGATTNVSMEDAATSIGQMTQVIGLQAKDFDNYTASLVDLGNAGNSTEAQILEIARRSGGAAKLIGIATNETLGWAAAAANLGLNEELAGTAVQNFFIKTQAAITEGGGALINLAKTSGKTTKQFKKDFDKNATGALTDFLEGLAKMPKDARLTTIRNVFGKGSGLTRLIIGLSDSMDTNLHPSLKRGTKAWKEATAAQEEADKRFATSASNFIVLKNNIDNAAATIGANLLPVLVELSKEATTFLADPQTQANIKTFGRDLATGAREAVKWLKSLDWNAIGNSLKTAAGFGKGIVDAFMAAPPWVQQFLTAGFVANKFTGGAIGSIIGELGRGLVKGVLGMTAGVVNIKAGVVNCAGGVPGAAGAAGAAGWGASIAGALSVAAPAIGAAIGSHLVTEETNKGLGTNFTAPGAGGIGPGAILTGLQNLTEVVKYVTGQTTAEVASARAAQVEAASKTTTAVEGMRGNLGGLINRSAEKQTATTRAAGVTAAVASRLAGERTWTAARTAGITAALAAQRAGQTTASAIARKRLSVTTHVNVRTNISGREWLAAATQTNIRGGAS